MVYSSNMPNDVFYLKTSEIHIKNTKGFILIFYDSKYQGFNVLFDWAKCIPQCIYFALTLSFVSLSLLFPIAFFFFCHVLSSWISAKYLCFVLLSCLSLTESIWIIYIKENTPLPCVIHCVSGYSLTKLYVCSRAYISGLHIPDRLTHQLHPCKLLQVRPACGKMMLFTALFTLETRSEPFCSSKF